MAWQDEFRSGSFRGVPFKTTSHQLTGGRRKQDREFAKRDLGNSEDLGRRLKAFTLELYVLGDDYFSQRDALLEALDTEGQGTLIHPYLGTVVVQSGNYTLSETVEEGRIARFSVEFAEAGQVKFPDQVADDLAQATDSADLTIENASSAFESAFSVLGQAAFVFNAAAANATAIADFLDESVKKVTEPIANLTFAIRNFKADVEDLIKKPGELADRVADMFNTLVEEIEDDPEVALRVLGNFDNFPSTLEPVLGDTPSRNQERDNQDATIGLTSSIALSNSTKSAVDVDFLSTQAALLARDAIVDGLDVLLLQATDDDLFQSIKDQQTALTRAVPRTGTTELVTITPPKTIPALVIAHSQFEDLEKEIEIIDQNAIEHPGFVPGGDPIEVSAG